MQTEKKAEIPATMKFVLGGTSGYVKCEYFYVTLPFDHIQLYKLFSIYILSPYFLSHCCDLQWFQFFVMVINIYLVK